MYLREWIRDNNYRIGGREVKVSVEISEKAKLAAETEVSINTAREDYRVVASRGALLFFLLSSLVRVHALYQFSLSSFITIVERAIDRTAQDAELATRLRNLNETVCCLPIEEGRWNSEE